MDVRIRLIMITILGLVAALVWTLPQWWTYANPGSSVAECLPNLAIDVCAQYANFSRQEKASYQQIFDGDEDDERAPKPAWAQALVNARVLDTDSPAPEANDLFEAPAGANEVATGEFSNIDNVRQARGDLTIYQEANGRRFMRLGDEFYSTRAPDIHIIFTRNPDPNDVTGVGVDYIDVGELKGNFGAQIYDVPASVDFSRYPVLALYSPSYDAVLATATLQ